VATNRLFPLGLRVYSFTSATGIPLIRRSPKAAEDTDANTNNDE
jgi:hypothetical protein